MCSIICLVKLEVPLEDFNIFNKKCHPWLQLTKSLKALWQLGHVQYH